MSGGLVSFGSYSFSNLGSFSCNFGQGAGKIIPSPGLEGGWNADGSDGPVAMPGRVTQTFRLIASSRAEMDDLRDAVNALYFGEDRLVYQPTDLTDPERWTWAVVENITMQQDKGMHTDLWQTVNISFLCPEPVWWVDAGTGGWSIGDGTLLDDGALIGAGGDTTAASGTSTLDTISNNGNTPYIPEIVIQPQSSDSCENPVIQRLVGTLVVDEIAYTGVIIDADALTVNGRTGRVELNGVSVWDDLSYLHPALFRLAPGSNSIRVLFKNGGDAADVIFYYRHTYR